MCVKNVYMKPTHSNIYNQQQEIDKIVDLLSAQKLFEEKTRINLYLPKIIVKLIDKLSKNASRGELVTSLVINEVKKRKKLPFGMFTGADISEKEINKISASLDKTANELS